MLFCLKGVQWLSAPYNQEPEIKSRHTYLEFAETKWIFDLIKVHEINKGEDIKFKELTSEWGLRGNKQ